MAVCIPCSCPEWPRPKWQSLPRRGLSMTQEASWITQTVIEPARGAPSTGERLWVTVPHWALVHTDSMQETHKTSCVSPHCTAKQSHGVNAINVRLTTPRNAVKFLESHCMSVNTHKMRFRCGEKKGSCTILVWMQFEPYKMYGWKRTEQTLCVMCTGTCCNSCANHMQCSTRTRVNLG